MKSKGIRILDKIGKVVSVELPDILEKIKNGNALNWSILDIWASGHLGEGKSILVLEDQITQSEKGLFINWKDLNELASKFYQVYDITIVGSADLKNIHRYESEQEMYETCDIVIKMIDSGYWEVFSKDEAFIKRLAANFKDIEFLEPDYER